MAIGQIVILSLWAVYISLFFYLLAKERKTKSND